LATAVAAIQVLPLPQPERWQLTGDGQAFVGWFENRLSIYDAATLTQRTSTPARLDRAFLDTSPDGEWAATGSWEPHGVQVWNVRTGKLVRELPSRGISMVSFSPDGRWLAVRDSHSCQLWQVGTWTPGVRVENAPGDTVGCPAVFTQGGRIAALRGKRSSVLLIDTTTGRQLAILESPDPHDIFSLCFTDDDTKLVVAHEKHSLCVWDLRRIRRHLSQMGLDWEAPRSPRIAPSHSSHP
jgi:WD40 repeat protein